MNKELGFTMKCIYCPYSKPKNNFKTVTACICPLKEYSCPLNLAARNWPIKVINHVLVLLNKFPELILTQPEKVVPCE